ncbi:MAG TPA: aminotransferase class V-fold PLP-dependent enzyme [Candidatus Thorarchaeota archaeon]|nr:aminotransferase class V-fold PLP-dependent enzyme [Candidatus Thorarchaeota archaeon]
MPLLTRSMSLRSIDKTALQHRPGTTLDLNFRGKFFAVSFISRHGESNGMPDTITSDFITENFPTLSEMTYLNNASTGIPPSRTVEAMKGYLDGRLRVEGKFEDTLRALELLREELALLLGGRRENYALTTSTSDGLNMAAHGIDYPEGSNIVICDLEFPANYIPWQNASRWYDVELRVVRSENGAATPEQFMDMIDENTRVVAVSLVQFASGYRTDVKQLARAVHDVGGILVVDIIQAAGWADFNLAQLDVDFAAAQAAKWMIGPIGAGFIYVSDRTLEVMKPRFTSWWGVENVMEFGYAERKLLKDARKFHVGSLALVAHVGLLESVRLLLEIPNRTRERTAMAVADYLRKRLSEMDIEYYDFGPKYNSAIVSCVPRDMDTLLNTLAEHNIYCSVRNGRLRVSPHFYNTTEDIDRLVAALE